MLQVGSIRCVIDLVAHTEVGSESGEYLAAKDDVDGGWHAVTLIRVVHRHRHVEHVADVLNVAELRLLASERSPILVDEGCSGICF